MLTSRHNKRERRRYSLSGAVQGVGFRPFVYRRATDHQLSGWVKNSAVGVVLEVEGNTDNLRRFEDVLQQDKPQNAVVDTFVSETLELQNDMSFRIVAGERDTPLSVPVLPDLSVCLECLAEMNDPEDRRYRYPFINCTNCGPRFTIITGLPYDRPQTTLSGFTMCGACHAEYTDPEDRRFYAQPIGCPDCGPHVELWGPKGTVLSVCDQALIEAAEVVRQGGILALKGLGGFHLIVDATNVDAVNMLRERKSRLRKPFALMVASLEDAKKYCEASGVEATLLCSPEAPIMLLRKKEATGIAGLVAPGNPYLGIMLPYTPLHHLLMREIITPVIATSGNRSGEPVCIDEYEALDQLSGIADFFLVHNRPIKHRAEDSIVRVIAGREMILRRGRGYAPLPIPLANKRKAPVLAVGSHMKNTVALAVAKQLVLGPHIGDLETLAACDAHEQEIRALCDLYKAKPERVMCDKHPDYRSSQMAKSHYGSVSVVQHHYAHALSCMLDNEISPPVLAVVWDGTGYGEAGTIWGGEFLLINEGAYERVFHFRLFPLAGGEAAVKKPCRTAYGLLFEAGLHKDLGFDSAEESLLRQALGKEINCPLTSSVGRLFDAMAALCALATENSFEGEAAMAMEFAAIESQCSGIYSFDLLEGVVDWKKMLQEILEDIEDKRSSCEIARKFHNTLVAVIVSVAKEAGQKRILLTGGCFQNKLLLEGAIDKLRAAGFEPFWHHRIPPNDGGIAAGQIMAAVKE